MPQETKQEPQYVESEDFVKLVQYVERLEERFGQLVGRIDGMADRPPLDAASIAPEALRSPPKPPPDLCEECGGLPDPPHLHFEECSKYVARGKGAA